MSTLSDELGRLRRGRGVMADDLRDRIGPTLRALSGIDESDSQDLVRVRLIAYLNDLTTRMPDDLRIALSAGLALDEDVRHRFFDARMQWLANKLQRDIRTARRRVDEAIRSAEAMSVAATASGGNYAPGGWYLARFRTVLLLDGGQPTAIEDRSIISTTDGLTELLVSTRVPRVGRGVLGDHRVDLGVLYGASLTRPEQASASYFRYFLQLPRPLNRGESHDIGVSVTIPAGQPMNPRYSFQPLRRCQMYVDLIRVYLRDYGSQKDLARALGLTEAYLSFLVEPLRTTGTQRQDLHWAEMLTKNDLEIAEAFRFLKTPSEERASQLAAELCTEPERREVLQYHIAMARASARDHEPTAGMSLDDARSALAITSHVHGVALGSPDAIANRSAYAQVWSLAAPLAETIDPMRSPIEYVQALMFLHDMKVTLEGNLLHQQRELLRETRRGH